MLPVLTRLWMVSTVFRSSQDMRQFQKSHMYVRDSLFACCKPCLEVPEESFCVCRLPSCFFPMVVIVPACTMCVSTLHQAFHAPVDAALAVRNPPCVQTDTNTPASFRRASLARKRLRLRTRTKVSETTTSRRATWPRGKSCQGDATAVSRFGCSVGCGGVGRGRT